MLDLITVIVFVIILTLPVSTFLFDRWGFNNWDRHC